MSIVSSNSALMICIRFSFDTNPSLSSCPPRPQKRPGTRLRRSIAHSLALVPSNKSEFRGDLEGPLSGQIFHRGRCLAVLSFDLLDYTRKL